MGKIVKKTNFFKESAAKPTEVEQAPSVAAAPEAVRSRQPRETPAVVVAPLEFGSAMADRVWDGQHRNHT